MNVIEAYLSSSFLYNLYEDNLSNKALHNLQPKLNIIFHLHGDHTLKVFNVIVDALSLNI